MKISDWECRDNIYSKYLDDNNIPVISILEVPPDKVYRDNHYMISIQGGEYWNLFSRLNPTFFDLISLEQAKEVCDKLLYKLQKIQVLL